MLITVAEGVLVHTSELLQNNTIVVQGEHGVLLVDPGITGTELACLASDLRALGQPVVAGFSTHPDWDHALWHADFGDAPRYGTARAVTFLREFLSNDDWRDQLVEGLPPEIAHDIPIEQFGLLTPLPDGATHVPWNGPAVRVIEHPAHAEGHAALVIDGSRVLVAGDMLSDILMPFPDLGAADPLGDYLVGLQRLEDAAATADVVIPGHGSVGTAHQLHARIALDREYIEALRDRRTPDDPRIQPDAAYGSEWLHGVYEWQAQQLDLIELRSRDATGTDAGSPRSHA